MAYAKGKRVLREKDGETLWAEFEKETEHHSKEQEENTYLMEDQVDHYGPELHYADQEEYTCNGEDLDSAKWKDISNGIKVYLPSMHEESRNVKAVRWTSKMRSDSSFTDNINLPKPSLFLTDIYEICVDRFSVDKAGAPSFESNLLYKTEEDIPITILVAPGSKDKKLTVRMQKPHKYDLNTRHYFSANIRIGSKWIIEPSTFKEGEFWFHAEQLSAFFIFASSKIDTFIVEPTGTRHSANVDNRIELDFEEQTVTYRTPMKLKIWPTNEGKIEEVIKRSDEQRISAISDTIFLEHRGPKLYRDVNITMPLHGDTEIKSGENLFLLSYTPDCSDIEYKRLETGEFYLSMGNVKVAKEVISGYGNGIVKTKAKSIRSHEVLELISQGYYCQFLYFKLPGGNESSFQLWVECVRKEEVVKVQRRNVQQNMVEFPFSISDDTPIYDQENMQITIRGSVKIRGNKRIGASVPVNMRFLAVSETTHARIPLVKHQMIDGAHFADVDISFTPPRGRKPIKSQLDPWGRIMQLNKKSVVSVRHRKLKQEPTSSENECFKEKSLQALALAVPPNQAKILARELSLENTVIERLYEENNKNIAEFTVNMLLYWKKATDPDNRFECLLEALEELRLQGIVSVLKEKHTENTLMRSSDFEK